MVRELATGTQRFMPENLALTVGEGGLGSALGALTPLLMRRLGGESAAAEPEPAALKARGRVRVRSNGVEVPTAQA